MQEIIAGLKELPAHHWTQEIKSFWRAFSVNLRGAGYLEENQLRVVADDLAQESRQYRTDTGKGAAPSSAWPSVECPVRMAA